MISNSPSQYVWHSKRILIVVRTYPAPANKGAEVSCTAGLTEDGKWIRLFPIPWRALPPKQRFRKYQWIEATVKKARDYRVESYEVDVTSITVLGKPIVADDGWVKRRARLQNFISTSLCQIAQECNENRTYEPTLGLVRPKNINGLDIDTDSPDWSQQDQRNLLQMPLMDHSVGQTPALAEPTKRALLEKIPFKFHYRFDCDKDSCTGHRLLCTDWEMLEAYRKWSSRYGRRWEHPFRSTFEQQMQTKYDTHFFVGTLKAHPATWIIVGLFYPPLSSMRKGVTLPLV